MGGRLTPDGVIKGWTACEPTLSSQQSEIVVAIDYGSNSTGEDCKKLLSLLPFHRRAPVTGRECSPLSRGARPNDSNEGA